MKGTICSIVFVYTDPKLTSVNSSIINGNNTIIGVFMIDSISRISTTLFLVVLNILNTTSGDVPDISAANSIANCQVVP